MSPESTIDTLQFYNFKECLARRILTSPEYDVSMTSEDATQLDEFTLYLASEVWPVLPVAIRDASRETREEVPDISSLDLDTIPIPTSFADTLVSYGITSDWDSALLFLRKSLKDYLRVACAPMAPWKSTRTKECEICERDVPLTYHHLIPRSTHEKVLRKGWHDKSMINSVAWLCRYVSFDSGNTVSDRQRRQCHSTVHHVTTNEDLAMHYYTVELLLQRDDIIKWKSYASRQQFRTRHASINVKSRPVRRKCVYKWQA
jgi:hypothetical protein